jgi:hypothetical protein
VAIAEILQASVQAISVEFYTGGYEDRTWASKTKESPMLKPLPGKGWEKHSRLEKV